METKTYIVERIVREFAEIEVTGKNEKDCDAKAAAMVFDIDDEEFEQDEDIEPEYLMPYEPSDDEDDEDEDEEDEEDEEE